MNFYEKARDHLLHNKVILISYTIGYVCFMNTPGSLVNTDDNWYEWYLNLDQVNRKAMNALKDKDLEFDKSILDHRFATVCYIVLEILNRYFG